MPKSKSKQSKRKTTSSSSSSSSSKSPQPQSQSPPQSPPPSSPPPPKHLILPLFCGSQMAGQLSLAQFKDNLHKHASATSLARFKTRFLISDMELLNLIM